jgi:general secretion pathway protein K
VVPSAGLVNLNKAEPALLADLFVHAGGVHPARAEQLAEMVRAHREPLTTSDLAAGADGEAARRIQRRETRFDVPEDLLGIEGVDLELYDRLADLVTVQSPGGRVHPAAAPPELVAVLAGGDLQAAQRFILGRESNDPTTDTTGLNHVTPAVPSDRIYRFDAELRSDRGIVYRRSAWADLSRRNEPLPYRLLEVHPVRSIALGASRR